MGRITRTAYTPGNLRLREAPDGSESRSIEGYAVVFDTPSVALYEDERDIVREVIDRGAITKELLDGCDIKMTLFHDRSLILARSKDGQGTLSYEVDDHGVKFAFDAPHTADGDKAVELVKRGDLSGCSFAFTTDYSDSACVSREIQDINGRRETTYHVRRVSGVYDFTLAADPAYEDTSVEAREAVAAQRAKERETENRRLAQLAEMRAAVDKYSHL